MDRSLDSSRAHAATTPRTWRAALTTFISVRLQARRRGIEQEKEFYRRLGAYCRTNNLPAVCGDDWKTAAYSDER
jgi:hypothetical protein